MSDEDGIWPMLPPKHPRSVNSVAIPVETLQLLEITIGTGCQLWLAMIDGVE